MGTGGRKLPCRCEVRTSAEFEQLARAGATDQRLQAFDKEKRARRKAEKNE